MQDFVDGYCERTAYGFWNEPVNAVTNLAFMVAAYVLWRAAGPHGRRSDPFFTVPLSLLIATGVGSFLFHTTATRWGGALDTAALSLCLLATVYAGARRWLGMAWLPALLWPAGMVAAALILGRLPLPGAFYLGPFVTGVALAVLLWRRRHPAWGWIAAAVAVFVPSFIFRSLDEQLCDVWPVGTHFLWHILNGAVLGLAIAPLALGPSRGEGGQHDGARRADR